MDEQSHAAAEPRSASASPPESDALSASVTRSSNSSQVSGRALVLESDQKTVISKTPPLNVPLHAGVTVKEMGRLLVGERLGHFVLEEFVGGGGMGAVFRATDTELGRTVAVKVVSGAHNDEETLRRFKNEAQSAARLDHQHIARVYYVGEDKGWHYIVFEFIQGVNVRDLVQQKGPLTLEEAFHYTLQVAEALDHASKRDVIHRDIKPSNVLVMQNGMVKVVDMGLARLHQVESANELTASGVTLGTFDYISPEQARDPRSTDVRSDLYSLGCTLYFMLTGRPPFPMGTVLQKLLSHSSEPPPDPRDLRPDLGEEVVDVIQRLLAKNPNDRFQTPAELIGRLILVADELGVPLAGRRGAVLVTRSTAPLTRLEATLPWAVPIAVLMIVVIMIEVFSPAPQIAVQRPVLASARPARDEQAEDERGSERQGTNATAAASDPPQPAAPESSGATLPATGNDGEQTEQTTSASATADPSDPPNNTAAVAPPTTQNQQNASANQNSSANGTNGSELATERPVSDGNSGGRNTSTGDNQNPSASSQASNQIPPVSANSTDAQPLAVTRVIVSPADDDQFPSDAVHVTSLESALQKYKDLNGVQRIELWFNDELKCSPLTITVKEKLEIRAGSGFRPVLRFQPDLQSLATHPRMIEILGGDASWQGVHFQLQLPTEPSTGASLFGLTDVQNVEFQQCTFSVQNVDENDEMAFFEFQRSQVSNHMEMEMAMDMQDMTVPMAANPMAGLPPVLSLSNCAARGQATFVRAETAHPFILTWEQGLLITSERLFELRGAADKPKNWDARIEFKLQNVTAVVDEGIGLMDLGGKHVMGLVVDLKNCVVLSHVDSPLIEHRGVNDVNLVQNSLQYRGENNFYPTRTPPLSGPPRPRIHWLIMGSDGKEVDSVEFLTLTMQPKWYNETSATEHVGWVHSENIQPSDTPYHQQTKRQYELAPRNSRARAAGFDLNGLVDFPAIAGLTSDL